MNPDIQGTVKQNKSNVYQDKGIKSQMTVILSDDKMSDLMQMACKIID
jgi:hypothetical protein